MAVHAVGDGARAGLTDGTGCGACVDLALAAGSDAEVEVVGGEFAVAGETGVALSGGGTGEAVGDQADQFAGGLVLAQFVVCLAEAAGASGRAGAAVSYWTQFLALVTDQLEASLTSTAGGNIRTPDAVTDGIGASGRAGLLVLAEGVPADTSLAEFYREAGIAVLHWTDVARAGVVDDGVAFLAG